jgi:hypothetical protein
MSGASQRDADLVRAAYYAGYRAAARHAAECVYRVMAYQGSVKRLAGDVCEISDRAPPYPPPVADLDLWIEEHPETEMERRFREDP